MSNKMAGRDYNFIPVTRYPGGRWSAIGVAAFLAVASDLSAQTIAPTKKDSEIVINPTLAECNRGWTADDQVKWSKLQFDLFCATLNSPAEIVANPTLPECARGWDATMRWSKDRFDDFCTILKSSK